MTTFTMEHMTGFGGVNFGISWGFDDVTMQGWHQESYAETRHVPGGNVNITQLLGHGAASAEFSLFFETKAEFDTFMALRQTQGMLTLYAAMCEFNEPSWEVNYFGTTYLAIPDVLLMRVYDIRTRVDGPVECSAVFQLQEWPA